MAGSAGRGGWDVAIGVGLLAARAITSRIDRPRVMRDRRGAAGVGFRSRVGGYPTTCRLPLGIGEGCEPESGDEPALT